MMVAMLDTNVVISAVSWLTCWVSSRLRSTRPRARHATVPVNGLRCAAASSRVAEPIQRSGLRFPGPVELVQVPPQPTNDPSPFSDKGFTMITEQPHVAVRAIQPGRGKVGLALCGPRDGMRINGIGLSVPSRARGPSTSGTRTID